MTPRRQGPAADALFGPPGAPRPAVENFLPPPEPALPFCHTCGNGRMRRVDGKGREDEDGAFMMCENSMKEWAASSFAEAIKGGRIHKRPEILPVPAANRRKGQPKAPLRGKKALKAAGQKDLFEEQERRDRRYK